MNGSELTSLAGEVELVAAAAVMGSVFPPEGIVYVEQSSALVWLLATKGVVGNWWLREGWWQSDYQQQTDGHCGCKEHGDMHMDIDLVIHFFFFRTGPLKEFSACYTSTYISIYRIIHVQIEKNKNKKSIYCIIAFGVFHYFGQ